MLKDKESGLKFLDKIDNVIVNEQKNYTLSNFDISKKLPASHIITRFSEFGEKRLIEIGRGCIRRCKFCVMGNTKKPVKFVKPELIKDLLKDEKYPIGIISATITDYPWLDELLDILEYYEIKFSVSSMRADGITKRLLRLLKESGQNTYTIAPEGISQKIRDVMLKDLNEEELLTALEMGRMEDFSNVKLYYIVGFDEEDNEDFNELKSFIDKVKKLGYKSITLSINPLIPKKNTPFYGRKFINERRYNEIRKWMYENLKGVKLHFESYKLSKKQNLYNNISLEELINLFSK
ncbi:B12-binding domain-containing radical SAM protein [Thermosipho africanus]|uniref:B12-binding domain-containing radical SAM protein n=1 Tax=Thermosipho africanus TaxID=2421 RepID=UPI0002E61485|nr:radical SAM protein [Thermosipho africanus]